MPDPRIEDFMSIYEVVNDLLRVRDAADIASMLRAVADDLERTGLLAGEATSDAGFSERVLDAMEGAAARIPNEQATAHFASRRAAAQAGGDRCEIVQRIVEAHAAHWRAIGCEVHVEPGRCVVIHPSRRARDISVRA